MKNWVIGVICLLLGLVLGASASFLYFREMNNRFYQHMHSIMMIDQLNVLNHIRSGKEETLAGHLEEMLPVWTLDIPNVITTPQSATNILWQVQRYYETYGVTVPEQIKPLLDSLPPRPPSACGSGLEPHPEEEGPDRIRPLLDEGDRSFLP